MGQKENVYKCILTTTFVFVTLEPFTRVMALALVKMAWKMEASDILDHIMKNTLFLDFLIQSLLFVFMYEHIFQEDIMTQ